MLDFLKIATRRKQNGRIEVYPKFIIKKSKDLMIRGGDFYAIWVDKRGLWSTDEQDVIDLVDNEMNIFIEENKATFDENPPIRCYMWDSDTGTIDRWHKYCQRQSRDNFHQLDENLTFLNQETKRDDYASKKLPYPLEDGECPAYDKIMSTLYEKEERDKIEWAIGAIVSGDSKYVQKFLVLYGAAGTGKSTVLNIIQQLFDGYYSVFDAKALGSSSNSFALEAFKSNPLVAIQHDGDLSRIEDNTRLNSLVSHELMTVNEKFKSTYANRFNAFLFMGTNKPVKITDGKSGLIRRLIDVSPSGNKLPYREYKNLMGKIPFELGAIAIHCRNVYQDNPNRYDNYIPKNMLGASNDFYNFIVDSYFAFKEENGVSLKIAWEMYKTYCEDAKVGYPLPKRQFKEELKNYFEEFQDFYRGSSGEKLRNYFYGFKTDMLNVLDISKEEDSDPIQTIEFKKQKSVFDTDCKECPAQYAKDDGTPRYAWDGVDTKLSEIDTSKLHYVRVPENHIVIDFDISDENGNKSFERNLKEASKWPKTYAEVSKSGCGIHLHYIYTGEVDKLSRVYSPNVEIKVFSGKSSLRRKLTLCNDEPIATLNSGLPLKKEKPMVDINVIKSEKQLRRMIQKNLNLEYHPNTKPSVDFISELLDRAYRSGMHYDVSDMKNSILVFAANSSHQSKECLRIVSKMKFKSDDPSEPVTSDEHPIVFFDVEVFPNLFVVVYKAEGEDQTPVKMINPKSSEIEDLLKYRLIGFNNRKYDNHILYARLVGYSNIQLFHLSQDIIEKKRGFMSEAYSISYTDIYDFAAKKQGLKKWEIELGIHHQELGLPWDQPVPEELWEKVAGYCVNDVLATEAVFEHLKGDFTAREVLADLAGMTVNDTTNQLTTRIIFGTNRHPELVYTDLSEEFPGYEYKKLDDGKWHNMYRGVDLGYGGYVYAEPGMYLGDTALLDVASLHPHSIIALNLFGKYTEHFADLVNARIHIKHGDYETVRHMFGGRLAKYLDDESTAKQLAQALKIAINSVYGLTSASFDNPFKDPRNKNNIVALRGALFMKTLQDEVASRGFTVVHIKTDSIKIADATPEIIQFCMEFAKKYKYEFEHEATYDRICLVNDAVYIARYSDDEKVNGKHANKWTATGTQFQVPYVFKTLFSHEPIEFRDKCETKQVTSALYLDMNEKLDQFPDAEKELEWREKDAKKNGEHPSDYIVYRDPTYATTSTEQLKELISKSHNYMFVGRVGQFCPIKPGCGGGVLLREQKGKYYAATGSKGYRWLESEMVQNLGKEEDIDLSYYNNLVDEAIDNISKYGDFETFVA